MRPKVCSQAAVDEVNKAKKPRRMAVLRGIPADDDEEKAAVGGNHSQPRVVPPPPLPGPHIWAFLRVVPVTVLLLSRVSCRPARTHGTLHLCRLMSSTWGPRRGGSWWRRRSETPRIMSTSCAVCGSAWTGTHLEHAACLTHHETHALTKTLRTVLFEAASQHL